MSFILLSSDKLEFTNYFIIYKISRNSKRNRFYSNIDSKSVPFNLFICPPFFACLYMFTLMEPHFNQVLCVQEVVTHFL